MALVDKSEIRVRQTAQSGESKTYAFDVGQIPEDDDAIIAFSQGIEKLTDATTGVKNPYVVVTREVDRDA